MNNLDILYPKLSDYPSPKRLYEDLNIDIGIIGIGSARLVIQDPNNKKHILKLGVGNGIQQNKNEIKVWNISKKRNVSDILLPIIEYDKNHRWIKMPKVNTQFGLDKYVGPDSERIHLKLKENNIDLHEIETCIYHQEPMAFDYGALEAIRPVKNFNN